MKRKGFTLAELAVVIALSSLLAAVLISLIVALAKYTSNRRADREEENELKDIEAMFNGLSDYDGAEYVFTVVAYTENGNTSEINVTKSYDGVETDIISLVYTMGVEEGVAGTLSFGETKITIENVGNITFGGTDGLLKCTVGDNAVYMLSLRAAKVVAEE